MQFSPSLIAEYRAEMAATYDMAVSVEDAQLQLHSLVLCLFGSAVGGGAGARTLVRHRAAEVGDSITPTSGHLDKMI